MDQKDYNKLLLDCYKENNANIEKWIFLASTGALTILVGFSDKIVSQCYFLFAIAIIFFLVTIIFQLISAFISKKGCDLGLDEEGKFNEESIKCFDISEKLNKCFLVSFIIAIVVTSVAIMSNNYATTIKTQHNKHKNIIEQRIKIKELEYYVKEGVANE